MFRLVKVIVRYFWFGFSKKCRIHKVTLQKTVVPIEYGLITEDRLSRVAKSHLFPNTKRYIKGGCLIGSEKTAKVRFCLDCRIAEDNWNELSRDTRLQQLIQVLRVEDPEVLEEFMKPSTDPLDDITEIMIEAQEKGDSGFNINPPPVEGGLADTIARKLQEEN